MPARPVRSGHLAAPTGRSLAPAAAAVLGVLTLAAPTRAASPFDGKWKQGPLREEYTVQRWNPSVCGPAPTTSSTGGGEVVTVALEGDILSFVGGGRVYKSNQCWDPMPTLARDTHQRDPSGRVWRTRCSTPPADPRRATLNTLVQATSDTHLELVETGRYEITIKDTTCIADVKRTRGYDLVQGDVPVPAVSSAPPPPPPACASPGEPARLEVRPSRKLLRKGESFVFGAVVLDAKGCRTDTPIAWSVEPGGKTQVNVDPYGRVTVPDGAPEGRAELVATAAGKSARVTVDVSSPENYAELLAQSGLNAAGENDTASVAVIATGSIGGADARAVDDAARRRSTFLAIVGGLVGLLAIVGVVGWRRSKRARELEATAAARHAEKVREVEARKKERVAAHAAQLEAHLASVRTAEEARRKAQAQLPKICPTCRRDFPPDGSFCPHDGTRLVPMNVGAAPPASGLVCPTCDRAFDAGVRVCPHDGSDLVPAAMHSAKRKLAPKGRICPTCGQRFEGEAAFCGKDGTALVLLN
jgi:hypothetical protein